MVDGRMQPNITTLRRAIHTRGTIVCAGGDGAFGTTVTVRTRAKAVRIAALAEACGAEVIGRVEFKRAWNTSAGGAAARVKSQAIRLTILGATVEQDVFLGA